MRPGIARRPPTVALIIVMLVSIVPLSSFSQDAYAQAPTITIIPAAGPPGTPVVAYGTGWPAGDNVGVWWSFNNQAFRQLVVTSVGSNGQFSVSFEVPLDAAPGGNHIINFIDPPDGCVGGVCAAEFSIYFDVTNGPIDCETIDSGFWFVDPESAYAGDYITIAGDGDDYGPWEESFGIPMWLIDSDGTEFHLGNPIVGCVNGYPWLEASFQVPQGASSGPAQIRNSRESVLPFVVLGGGTSLPDIVVTSAGVLDLNFDPVARICAGDTYEMAGYFYNAGGSESGPFNIEWHLSDGQVGTRDHHSLTPDGYSRHTDPYTLSSPGQYSLTITADYDNRITEFDEGNNSYSTSFVVEDCTNPQPSPTAPPTVTATPTSTATPTASPTQTASPTPSPTATVPYFCIGAYAKCQGEIRPQGPTVDPYQNFRNFLGPILSWAECGSVPAAGYTAAQARAKHLEDLANLVDILKTVSANQGKSLLDIIGELTGIGPCLRAIAETKVYVDALNECLKTDQCIGFMIEQIQNLISMVHVWEQADEQVATGDVSQTWMWGPKSNTPAMDEYYFDSVSDHLGDLPLLHWRTVRYFDKSRMEISDPGGDSNSIWHVTNGLLVNELMTGHMQIADDAWLVFSPAQVNVAGDTDDPTGVTYATLALLMNVSPLSDGAVITQEVDRLGNVTSDPGHSRFGVTAGYHLVVPGIDHQVASVFWEFMISTGYENLFYTTGYPIAEAYWANVKVGGTYKYVLLQCFERRCLTYTPDNPDGWKVEAGNVGLHYYTWRYEASTEQPQPPPPSPPDEPAPPAAGDLLGAYDPTTVWPTGNITDSITAEVRDGVYYVQSTQPAAQVFYIADLDYSDTSTSIDVKLINDSSYSGACVVARFALAPQRDYELCLMSDGTTLARYYQEDQETIILLEGAQRTGPVSPYEWNTLEIRARGDQFWFFANGVLLGYASAAGGSSGSPGFQIETYDEAPGEWAYRNLEVRQLE